MEINQIEDYVSDMSKIEICTELFKRRDFSFIVDGKDDDGNNVSHEKQREALKILTSNEYSEFMFGGAAGGAKTWTGSTWLLFMCLIYPNSRWFIARNELKDLVESVMVTFKKVSREYGFSDFKFNAVKNFIEFGNGSYINLIEIKYKPSDPMFEDVGSTEYTGGWIEESSEINQTGAMVIGTRVGRHMNRKFGIKGIVLYTCNPKKNWNKIQFYDKWKNNTLEPYKAYLPSLVTDNPFIEKDYMTNLKRLANSDKSLYERLFKGNWDYEDNPNALCDYDMIEQIFDNDHVKEGTAYLTADVARYGSDKAVIMVWKGWKVIDMITYDISKTTDIESAIMLLRRKYSIPKNRCLADADGVGGGVIDGSGIVGFNNNARAVREKGKDVNYQNIKTQCHYLLADRINDAEIWLDLDLSTKRKTVIMQELDQIQSANKNDRKLSIKSKDDIKQDIGRSPDYLDCLMMRCYFDLKPVKKRGLMTRKRTSM